MFTLKPTLVRPNIAVKAKKNEFVEPAEAPGEGRRRPPNAKENEDSKKGVHPIKHLRSSTISKLYVFC